MTLPIRTTIDDIRDVCRYLATKPAGATIAEAKSVLDKKRLDGRKVSALKTWGLIEETDAAKLKVTADGRNLAKGDEPERTVLLHVVRRTPAYNAIVERAAHRKEDSLDTAEVGAHWHDHFREDAGENETMLKDRAVCFFNVAAAAGLGSVVAGRRGHPTRISFLADKLAAYLGSQPPIEAASDDDPEDVAHAAVEDGLPPDSGQEEPPEESTYTGQSQGAQLGQAIFVAHGKNKKPLEQLKKILDKFHIPYKVALDEPNLGRPIGAKVREIMHACNCAILIFSADEEFCDKDGKSVWRPSENVVYELGATGYLYDNRIVILKEEGVNFPTNFRDIGYISFEHDQLEAKAMDVLGELIGFGIVRVST